MFSVKQFGKELESWKYSWDEKNKIFRADEEWILQGRDGYSCDNVTHFAYMNFNRPEKE